MYKTNENPDTAVNSPLVRSHSETTGGINSTIWIDVLKEGSGSGSVRIPNHSKSVSTSERPFVVEKQYFYSDLFL